MKKKIEPYLQEWNGVGNVLDYLYDAKKNNLYDLCVKAREKHRASERYNFVDGKSNGQQIDILLAPVNSIEEITVKGIFINVAFGIYLSNKWNIVHLPSGRVYVEGVEEEQALRLIDAFMHYDDKMQWGTVQSHFDYMADKEIKEVFKSIKQDIVLNKEVEYIEYEWGADWKFFMTKWDSLIGTKYFDKLLEDWKYDAEIIKSRSRFVYENDSSDKHLVVKGPTGVGKTTIIAHLAEALYLLGLMPLDKCIEVTRRDIASASPEEMLNKLNQFVLEANDGVLIIDEIYKLAQGDNSQEVNRLIVDQLLSVMQGECGNVVLVLSGIPHEIDKFLNNNEEFRDQFNKVIDMKELSPEELAKYFIVQAEKDGFVVESGLTEKIVLMFENMRKANKLSNNIKSVNEVYKEIIKIQQRLSINDSKIDNKINEQVLKEVKRFRIGDQEIKALQMEAKKELDNLYGLEGAKERIRGLMETLEDVREQQRECSWLDEEPVRPNLLFMLEGNPGTAKTKIGKIMGKYIKGSGFLENGEFHKVNRADLIGEWIGHTSKKTMEVLEKAKGGVLFIDEAHNLAEGGENDFGKEALRLVMEYVYENRHDMVCILAVYPHKKEKLLAVDPGIKSRFSNRVELGNYTPLEILQILTNELLYYELNHGLKLGDGISEEIEKEVRSYGKRNKDFYDGNARWAVELAEKIYLEFRKKKNLVIYDIHRIIRELDGNVSVDKSRVEGRKDILKNAWEELDKMHGMEGLKKQFKEMEAVLKIQEIKKEKGMEVESVKLHATFLGASGVGKSTVARIYGKLLCGLGLLDKGDLYEIAVSDITSGDLASNVKSLKEWIQKSKGSVLFLDEAYGLASNHFGQEIIRELLPYLERNDWAFVMAGYEEKIEEVFQCNEGLKSRIGSHFMLDSYGPQEICAFILKGLSEYNLEGGTEESLMSYLSDYYEAHGEFNGNVRWAEEFKKKIVKAQEARLSREGIQNPEDVFTIVPKDINL
ncbi:AAA family ATPase [Bacillus bombysepticus]|uniref:AAA family ATPase n=1 Tax=Bacillus bombysepticus TaxID=658666 RepID=UPI0030197CE7